MTLVTKVISQFDELSRALLLRIEAAERVMDQNQYWKYYKEYVVDSDMKFLLKHEPTPELANRFDRVRVAALRYMAENSELTSANREMTKEIELLNFKIGELSTKRRRQ